MSTVDFNLKSLVGALSTIEASTETVSFAGQSLKLNSEDDAKPVIEEIDKCTSLKCLNLEGNTLGVDAAKGIAKSLEKHPEFKRALWKDMFTGRMKDEIPKALEFLGAGLVEAGARLTELDLSDNAFGPIGVQGLAFLLRSPSCYALETLRLNNNGLGITGGKLLAAALTDCYNSSKAQGKPLALKVFIAGRNRLENDGAKALAAVFQMLTTLEEVAMPQNGIYHAGITALSQAFSHNKNLKILNLNDNTITVKGAQAIASILPSLQNLKSINFGDCLLKTEGALSIAKGLKEGHQNLEELILDCNEIKAAGGMALVDAMADKAHLKQLYLNGNQFGFEGSEYIKERLEDFGQLAALGSLEDNESEDESDEDEQCSQSESEDSDGGKSLDSKEIEEVEVPSSSISVKEFLEAPNANNFLALGSNKEQLLLEAAQQAGQADLDDFVTIIMKVTALSDNNKPPVGEQAAKVGEKLYKALFAWAEQHKSLSLVNNSLLVNLGLIKGEDRKTKPTWNLAGCLASLKTLSTQSFLPETTRNTLKVFMQREMDRNSDHIQLKGEILGLLK
ncbi:ran GTPase-activating protein 1 [Dendroctonus ponderosae]|uniref:Ran-GTPase activating protein 1 C-terminal domain-containing protein n=1 Tax=Dendroctonus ponderosae TaxID=77166 RepID=A0AAR5PZX9_DENPD|nr:ran GTPase-activating protein 1 [Dendroctonus ponderosae]